MLLSFSCLTLTDFKSFSGGPHTLHFDKHPLGLCYVKGFNASDPRLGSNGSGKSSLWDAIVWCLYGKTLDNLRNPDIKSWFGGSKASVTLDVTIDDSEYTISRHANPNRLRINDKDVGQEEVETLIGLGFDTFNNTILLGQGRPLFFDLEPSAKLQLFSDVLDLTRWEDRSAKASAAASELDLKLSKVDRQLAQLEAKRDQVKADLAKSKERRDSWDTERQSALDDVRAKFVQSEAQCTAFKLKLADLEIEEDMATTQYQLSEKDSKDTFKVLFAKRDKLSEVEATKRSLEKSISRCRTELKELGEADACPTCGQSLEGTDLGKHKKEVRSRIKQYEREIAGLGYDDLIADYQVVEKKTNILTDLLNKEEARIKDLRLSAESWRRRCVEGEVLVRSHKDQIERLEEEVNPYSKMVRESSKLLASIREELDEVKDKKKSLEASIRRTKYWVKGFKDIRLLIMEEVLQELELVTTTMLQEVGLIGWRVIYSIEKETSSGSVKRGLNLDIYNPAYDKAVKWKSWSGGEAQRLRIIGSLALADVLLNHSGITCDIEILDEPIKHMGNEGVEDLCSLLSDRSRALQKQVWYIDHHTGEGSQFDSVVEVVKDKKRRSSIVRG